jgi:DNA-binding CsgD family transcriptional regulator
MALQAEAIGTATDGLMEAAALGTGWRGALQALATAADARGLLLMRGGPHGGPVDLIYTSELDEPCRTYMAGQRPPDSRQQRVHIDLRKGFVTDFDCYRPEEIVRDPFYQEFLRPRDFYWHACAMLMGTMGNDINFSFKRAPKQGHFAAQEIAVLNGALPTFRAIAQFAAQSLSLDEQDALTAATRRGNAAFLVDSQGRLKTQNRHADEVFSDALSLVKGKIVAADAAEQSGLDRVFAGGARIPGFASLSGVSGTRRFTLCVMPLKGEARTIFPNASAIATLIDHQQPTEFPARLVEAFGASHGLTPAECKVAALVASGYTSHAIAARLSISLGTARNHMKAVLAKTGCHREAELVLLLKELQNLWTP